MTVNRVLMQPALASGEGSRVAKVRISTGSKHAFGLVWRKLKRVRGRSMAALVFTIEREAAYVVKDRRKPLLHDP